MQALEVAPNQPSWPAYHEYRVAPNRGFLIQTPAAPLKPKGLPPPPQRWTS